MYKHQIDFFPSTVSKEMCQVLSIYLACEMWSHPYGTAHRHCFYYYWWQCHPITTPSPLGTYGHILILPFLIVPFMHCSVISLYTFWLFLSCVHVYRVSLSDIINKFGSRYPLPNNIRSLGSIDWFHPLLLEMIVITNKHFEYDTVVSTITCIQTTWSILGV